MPCGIKKIFPKSYTECDATSRDVPSGAPRPLGPRVPVICKGAYNLNVSEHSCSSPAPIHCCFHWNRRVPTWILVFATAGHVEHALVSLSHILMTAAAVPVRTLGRPHPPRARSHQPITSVCVFKENGGKRVADRGFLLLKFED
jgi:hypothetical protein